MAIFCQPIDGTDSRDMDKESTATMRPETVHTLLASEDRRTVLQYLARNGGAATVAELAQRLAEGAESIPGTGAGDARVRLHHVHLPKLADAGAVEYEMDAASVTLTTRGQQLDAVRKETATVLEESD